MSHRAEPAPAARRGSPGPAPRDRLQGDAPPKEAWGRGPAQACGIAIPLPSSATTGVPPVTNRHISNGGVQPAARTLSLRGAPGAHGLCFNHFAPGALLRPAPRILREPDTFPENYNFLGAETEKRVGGY